MAQPPRTVVINRRRDGVGIASPPKVRAAAVPKDPVARRGARATPPRVTAQAAHLTVP